MIDCKEYAKQMRENAVIDKNGNVIVSEGLWQQIASIIEAQQAEIEKARAEAIKEFAEKLDNYKEYRYNENCDFVPYVKLSDIEKTVKERVGAENESKYE